MAKSAEGKQLMPPVRHIKGNHTMAVSRSPKPFMGVRIPLPLFGFISTCHALTGAFLFARKPLFYAGFVPFLGLSDVVRCLIQSVLLYIEILGHTDVQMTMGLYGHAEDEQKRKQILAVNM